jgi:hypothetical protein
MSGDTIDSPGYMSVDGDLRLNGKMSKLEISGASSEPSNKQEERLVSAAAHLRRAVIEFLEALVALEKSGPRRSKRDRTSERVLKGFGHSI